VAFNIKNMNPKNNYFNRLGISRPKVSGGLTAFSSLQSKNPAVQAPQNNLSGANPNQNMFAGFGISKPSTMNGVNYASPKMSTNPATSHAGFNGGDSLTQFSQPKTYAQPQMSMNGQQQTAPLTTENQGATSPEKEKFIKAAVAQNQPQAQPQAQNTFTTPSGVQVDAQGNIVGGQQNGGQDMPGQPEQDPNDKYRAAFDQYLSALKPDDQYTKAYKDLSDFDLQSMKDQEKALNSGETLGFASGETQRVDRNNQFERMARSGTLEALTNRRNSTTDAAKARLDFESGLLGRGDRAKELAFNQNLATQNFGRNKLESDRTFAENKRQFGLQYAQSERESARKAAETGSGSGSGGLTRTQINSTVNGIAGAFDNEPVVKEYNTVKRQMDTFDNLGDSATDDIQRVYAFAKIADPTSAVKEGEYNSIEKYSQAVLQRTGLNVKRIFTATGVLTPEARTAMRKTLEASSSATKRAYDQVSSEYQRQINDTYAGKPRQITNYEGSAPQKGSTGGSSFTSSSGAKYILPF